MPNAKYPKKIWMKSIMLNFLGIKLTSNAGIPLEHGFGKSEGVGIHLGSSRVCTIQLFANVAMSSV